MDLSGDIILTGAITGLGYALLAVGLLLVYRVSRILNFAHAQVGALAAAVTAKLVLDLGVPYWLGLVAGVALGALTSFVFERSILRPLATRPKVVLLVATLGFSQLAVAASNLLPDFHHPGPYPAAFSVRMHVLGLGVGGADIAMLTTLLLVAGGLTLFLLRSRYGAALLACSDNPQAARLAGIPVQRVSSVVFAASGGLAALTVILYSPVQGLTAGTQQSGQGTTLLLMAFTAALLGGFWSLPRAAVAGVGLGVVQALLFANTPSPGAATAWTFVILAGVVLVVAKRSGLAEDGASIAPATPPLPRLLETSRWAKRFDVGVGALAIVVAAAVPLVFATSSAALTLTQIVCYGLAALSVCVVTGWTGQITLGQFAFVGVGAFLTARLVNSGVDLFVSLGAATMAGAVIALVVGLPALRARGMYLAVLTLGFAVVVPAWLLPSGLLNPQHETLISVIPPTVAGYAFGDPRHFYYFCLVVLVAVLVVLSGVSRTGLGRRFRAVRDNETAAAANGINASAVKLQAFMLSGAIAALAGGLYGASLGVFQASQFSEDVSLSLVFMVVLGGVATLYGPLVAAIAIVGTPALLGAVISSLSDDVQNLTTLLGALAILLVLRGDPEGIGAGLRRVRHRCISRIAGAAGAVAAVRDAEPTKEVAAPPRPALEVRNVSVRFGGVCANDDVSFRLEGRSTMGLIGANGAGKSTLVNAISGFQGCEGSVLLGGVDLSRKPAYRRARAGLARTFQDARLYAGLTVSETIALALDHRGSSSLLGSMVWWPTTMRADATVRAAADIVAVSFGLAPWLDSMTGDLSTGMRRVLEIACVSCREPAVILLDEPAAGLAQREVEELGGVLRRLQSQTGAAMILVEHDLPFVMSISDRIVALGGGKVLADGSPEVVRRDPAVVSSYLGIDERAIARSEEAQRS